MKPTLLKCLAPLAVAVFLGCQTRPPATPDVSAAEPADSTARDQRTAAADGKEAPKPAPERTLEIPAGTELRVRLDHAVDTERHQPGDTFTATMDESVVAGGQVAIPKGAQVIGRVAGAKSSGRLRGRGYLTLTLDSFEADGKTYQLSTTSVSRATGDHKKRNTALIGGGAGVGALVGALAGGGKGAAIGAATGAAAGTAGAAATGKKVATFPAETLLRFELKEPVHFRG